MLAPFTAHTSLARESSSDPLTGLSSAYTCRKSAEAAIRTALAGVALLLLEVHNLQAVNDGFGQSTGDELIRKVAARLRSSLRSTDLVARLHGGRFAVLIQPAGQTASRERVAFRLLDLLSTPYLLFGNEVEVAASIGIAVAGTGTTYEEVLAEAEMALLAAKRAGGGTQRHFQPAFAQQADLQRSPALDLRDALSLGQLEVHYRPRRDVESNALIGLGAVLRWQHPHRGLLESSAFLPLCTDTALLTRIEGWALELACRQAAILPVILPVSVRVSGIQFSAESSLLESVKRALLVSRLEPARLEIEITEHLRLTHEASAVRVLSTLRSMGVRIVMHEFGIGFGSLAQLTGFPLDGIHIASSLAETVNAAGRSTVHAIAALGRDRGIGTYLDGVRSREHLAQFHREGSTLRGCQQHAALPPEDLRNFLQGATHA